jgi:hypothetical protein
MITLNGTLQGTETSPMRETWLHGLFLAAGTARTVVCIVPALCIVGRLGSNSLQQAGQKVC